VIFSLSNSCNFCPSIYQVEVYGRLSLEDRSLDNSAADIFLIKTYTARPRHLEAWPLWACNLGRRPLPSWWDTIFTESPALVSFVDLPRVPVLTVWSVESFSHKTLHRVHASTPNKITDNLMLQRTKPESWIGVRSSQLWNNQGSDDLAVESSSSFGIGVYLWLMYFVINNVWWIERWDRKV